MRVAALYDIHGNLPALDAVLSEIDRIDVDRIVVGGDFIWGPFPGSTVERLRALGDRTVIIAGNSEREVVDRLDESDCLPSHLVAAVRWTAEQMSEDQLEFVAGLAKTAVIEIDGLGPTFFCHASARSDDELITQATPDAVLAQIFEGVGQRLVVCGHTHMQYDRTIPGGRIVNPGSVGMPYEQEPGAYWALLGPDVVLQRTGYDVGEAAREIRATSFPYSRLADNLLSPGSREEMVEGYERARREACDAPPSAGGN